MQSIAYNHILILVFQCIIIASLLLTLFRLRTVFGLSLLFIALGVNQFLQVFLSSSLYLEIASGISVSSGTVVLFTGSLFAVLLIYIREDALETRKVIYALLAANLVLALLLYVFSWMLEDKAVINIYNLPKEFYTHNARVVLIGTLVLFIDTLAILLLYETISRYTKFLFFRILFTMVLVLGIDSLLFTLGVFYNSSQFQTILISGFIGKTLAAIIYATLFSFYLFYIDKKVKKSGSSLDSYSDFFNTFTFRQKYDQVSKEKQKIQLKLASTENYLQTIFDSTTDAIFIHDTATGQILDVNKAMCTMFGYTKKEALEGDMPLMSVETSPFTKEDAKKWIKKAVTEGNQLFDWKAKHKDGHIFWVEVSLKLVNLNGDDRIIASVRNIDERIKRKLELENIHEKELFLSKVSNCILERKSVKNIINSILKEAVEKLLASRISIVTLDKESKLIEMYSEGILKEELGNTKKMPLNDAFTFQDKLLNGEVVFIENIHQVKTPDMAIAKLKENGILSVINIPIMSDNRLLGVLNFGFKKVETYQKFDIIFGKKLSNLIGIAINQENLQRQISEHTKSLENLVLKRTKDLEEKNNLLERTNKVFVGRELKMKALKMQIEQLKKQYKSNE